MDAILSFIADCRQFAADIKRCEDEKMVHRHQLQEIEVKVQMMQRTMASKQEKCDKLQLQKRLNEDALKLQDKDVFQ